MAPSPDTTVLPGDVLLGKFRVERVLGQGGMAVVVAATNLDLGERVALKMLLPATLAYPHLVQRFLREAQATVKLRGQHVARVSDVGRMATGEPFLVMEYLDGRDLSALLDEERWGISSELAVDYVLQAIEGVAEAHARGIIHRDLKPSNLFLIDGLDGKPQIKVLDFGIAKTSFEEIDIQLTATTAVMGSPQYMSPEQARSARSVDVRSDVWALGVILYELLCGDVPFGGETLPACVAALTADPPKPIRDRRTDVPEELEQILLRCLEKRPADRFPDVGELALALAPFGPPTSGARVDRILGILTQPRSMRASSLSLSGAAREAEREIDFSSATLPDDAPAVSVSELGQHDSDAIVAAALESEETSLSATMEKRLPATASAPAADELSPALFGRRPRIFAALMIGALVFLALALRRPAAPETPPAAASGRAASPARGDVDAASLGTATAPPEASAASSTASPKAPSPLASEAAVAVSPPKPKGPGKGAVPGSPPGSPPTKKGAVACKGIFCE